MDTVVPVMASDLAEDMATDMVVRNLVDTDTVVDTE